MRVLILEPDLTGHHAPYLRHLIDALRELGQQTIVVTAPGATASAQFEVHLRDAAVGVEFDESATPASTNSYEYATGQYNSLQTAIARHAPDHVWVPFADLLTEYLALRNMLWHESPWRRGMEGEGLYFRGRFAYPENRWRRNLKPRLSRYLVARSPWTVLHWLDPLAWNVLQTKCPTQADRFRLMPDPVEPVTPIERSTARTRLRIPSDGRYVGCAGVLNHRKGVDLLVAAFARAQLGTTDRLLFAGPMDDATRKLLEPIYSDLLRAGRIIHIDRHLNVDDLMMAVSACDVVCLPNRHQVGSSSFVIRAAAARRPVLTAEYSWMKWAVPEFGLGWTVNVLDPAAFAAKLRETLDQSANRRFPTIADRFVRYHSAQNFQAHWTARLRQRLNLPPSNRLVPWQWVWDEPSAKSVTDRGLPANAAR